MTESSIQNVCNKLILSVKEVDHQGKSIIEEAGDPIAPDWILTTVVFLAFF